MFKKLKEFIKKHDKLYVIARCIKSINDPDMIKLLRGHYDYQYYDDASVVVHHYGDKYPDKIVVCIYNNASWGFCAMLFEALTCLSCADIIDAIPSILWSTQTLYYESKMNNETDNVFEYYFEPISDISYNSVHDYKNVLNLSLINNFCRNEYYENIRWFYSDYILNRYAYLYKKYIHLNEKTFSYIYDQINNLFDKSEKIIGVHVRGTDYGVGFKDHPIKIQPTEHIAKVKELLKSGKYSKIFLATDDLNAIELFKKEFSDKLVYYSDTFRTGNDIGPHSTPNNRDLHHYKLGLEVLRDVYTLANCDALVCGVSNVSIAARYVNLAIDRKFDEVVVLYNGINKTDSPKAQKVKAELSKKKPLKEMTDHDLHQNS